jgi:hypothetical protein
MFTLVAPRRYRLNIGKAIGWCLIVCGAGFAAFSTISTIDAVRTAVGWPRARAVVVKTSVSGFWGQQVRTCRRRVSVWRRREKAIRLGVSVSSLSWAKCGREVCRGHDSYDLLEPEESCGGESRCGLEHRLCIRPCSHSVHCYGAFLGCTVLLQIGETKRPERP